MVWCAGTQCAPASNGEPACHRDGLSALVVTTSVEQYIATGRQGIRGTYDIADDRRRTPARSRGPDAGIESCRYDEGSNGLDWHRQDIAKVPMTRGQGGRIGAALAPIMAYDN